MMTRDTAVTGILFCRPRLVQTSRGRSGRALSAIYQWPADRRAQKNAQTYTQQHTCNAPTHGKTHSINVFWVKASLC
jgi:hypothetical protein